MRPIGPVELREWKDNPTTEEILDRIRVRIEEIKEGLLARAGMEPLTDSMWAGYVRGLREEVLDLQPDEVEEA